MWHMVNLKIHFNILHFEENTIFIGLEPWLIERRMRK